MEMLADDAAEVIRQKGLESAHILGHSLGGYVAQVMALRHPEKVKSLTLVGTAKGGPGTIPIDPAILASWAEAAAKGPEHYARVTFPYAFSKGFPERDPELYNELLERRLAYPASIEGRANQAAGGLRFLTDGIDTGSILQPALVIHGDRDRIFVPENGRVLADALPNSVYAPIDSGHNPVMEHPDEVVRLAEEHIARVERDHVMH
jgi:pimeloyl-ACP methyl ester carboxylesterase